MSDQCNNTSPSCCVFEKRFRPSSYSHEYSGADKSLAQPGSKQATFPAFYGTCGFITAFTRIHLLSIP